MSKLRIYLEIYGEYLVCWGRLMKNTIFDFQPAETGHYSPIGNIICDFIDLSYSPEEEEDPFHRWFICGLIFQSSYRGLQFYEEVSDNPFSDSIHQKPEYHDHRERRDSVLILQIYFSSMETAILYEFESSLNRALFFIIRQHDLWIDITVIACKDKTA